VLINSALMIPADRKNLVGGYCSLKIWRLTIMRTINKTPLYLSIISFFISSMTIWLMPFDFFGQDENQTFAMILALVFWLFFILGFIFLCPVSRQRKRDRQYKGKSGIGLLRFFSNKSAIVFDALLIVGSAALVLSFIFPSLPGWITLAAIFTAVFSLEMHGIINGKNYAYICKAR